jgi:hypothetical protein
MQACGTTLTSRPPPPLDAAAAYFFFGGSMFAEDFTPQQNKINQDLFEDNQEMLAAEVGAGVRLLAGGIAESAKAFHTLWFWGFGVGEGVVSVVRRCGFLGVAPAMRSKISVTPVQLLRLLRVCRQLK